MNIINKYFKYVIFIVGNDNRYIIIKINLCDI